MDILRLLPYKEYQAAINANAPTALNPFATIADLIADTSIYTGDGTLTGGRTVSGGSFRNTLTFNELSTFSASIKGLGVGGPTTDFNIGQGFANFLVDNGISPGAGMVFGMTDPSNIYLEIRNETTGVNAQISQLVFPTPAASRTWTMPDASGTVALTDDIPAAGNTIYTANDAITSNRIVTQTGFTLDFQATDTNRSVNLLIDPTGDGMIRINANDTTGGSELNHNLDFSSQNGLQLSLSGPGYGDSDSSLNFNGLNFAVTTQDTGTGEKTNFQFAQAGGTWNYTDAGVNENIISLGGVMSIQDQINGQGIIYAADYSGGFVARSLVDKAYVDGLAGDNIYNTNGTLTGARTLDLATFNLDIDTGAGGKFRFSENPVGPPATKEMDIYVNSTGAFIHALGVATPGGTPLTIIGGEQPGQRGIKLQTPSNIIEWNDATNILIQDASAVTGTKTATWRDLSGTVAYLTDVQTGQTWTNATNVTTTRGGYDADATTLDAIADNLGTLISDLKAVGILS